MNKYQNGKIYKIVDVCYSKAYIGSTCEELSQRMARHRYMYNQHICRGKESYRSANRLFDEFGVDNCKIELVEEYPCANQMELHRREGYHIQNNDCVNKIVAGRSDKEYRDQNAEREKERHKDYYMKNQDKIKAYRESRKEEHSAYNKAYREENKDRINQQRKEYRQNNKDTISERNKHFYQNHLTTYREKRKEYYERQKEKLLAKTACPCGGTYGHNTRAAHFKTQIHQTYLAKQREQPEQEPQVEQEN